MSLALVRGGHLPTLFTLATKLIVPVAAKFGEGRGGGSLCLMRPDGQPILVGLMGDPSPPKKVREYWDFSQEKPRRLSRHPEHVSSFQSRNDAEEQYPGAIRGYDVLGGFSGLPWKAEEGFVIALFRFGGLISEQMVNKIVQTSDNELAGPIYSTMVKETTSLDIR